MAAIVCPGCKRELRVPDGSAGKKARCPSCREICEIPLDVAKAGPIASRVAEPPLDRYGERPLPAAERPHGHALPKLPVSEPQMSVQVPTFPVVTSAVAPPSENVGPATQASTDDYRANPERGIVKRPKPLDVSQVPRAVPMGDRWEMQSDDERVYGPVERGELDRWVSEGRVLPNYWVRREATEHWMLAEDVFPVLAAAHSRPCPYCAEAISVDAIKCKHCSSRLVAAPPVRKSEAKEKSLYSAPPMTANALNYEARQGYAPITAITTPLLISAIANLLIGMFWLMTCYGVIFAVPMFVLCGFEFALHGQAARMHPARLASQAQAIGICEIIIGMFNWFALICGILVLVGAANVRKSASHY